MLDYIEYLNIPVKVAIVLIGAFLIMQLVGEILEFKGKVVPEFVKVRKIFTRRKKEREMMQKMEKTLDKVQVTMDELNKHYSTDNIQMRDEWIKRVNSKLEQYDASMAELIGSWTKIIAIRFPFLLTISVMRLSVLLRWLLTKPSQ